MWQEMSAIMQEAVKMAPSLSKLSLERCDQEHQLSQLSHLAPDAVSISLQAGEEAMFCLRMLEFGRCVIMGLTIDCRSDTHLSELKSLYPDIFVEFDGPRKQVGAPIIANSPSGFDMNADQDWTTIEPTYAKDRDQRHQALYEMDKVLGKIRKLPGFEGFQLLPRSYDLMAMASQGPIIIFNCTKYRTDAIIVTCTGITSHQLSKADYVSAQHWMNELPKLVRGTRSTYRQRNERLEKLFLWLWDVAVEPALDQLQLEEHKDEQGLRRVWWIGTGGLARAPFHAAGDHSPGSTRNTISRVVSSYIPTMKALSFARRKKLGVLNNPDSRLLLVTMPTTPGENNMNSEVLKEPHQQLQGISRSTKNNSQELPNKLEGVSKEVEGIIEEVKGKTRATQLDRPSTDDVLKELPSCQAVHFACHGVSDSQNPSGSHLLLRKDNNTEEGTQDKLTVEAISATNLENAQIAYLSACSTPQNSSHLADESICIASGFQLAGFSHVLATQWVSKDTACQQVAVEFYRLLFSGSGEGHRHVSVSFHHAVKKLRKKYLRQPIIWACYIHTGA